MQIHLRIFILIATVFLSACEKVIYLELDDDDVQYVIEGLITNESGGCKVFISKTTHFNNENVFENVSAAVVKVKDNGNEFLLQEKQPGYYETNQVNGVPGHVYELSVLINNRQFTATCRMPEAVTLDTLYISPGPFGEFLFPNVGYTDPAGINNGYRFVQYVNGIKDPAIFWEDDEFTDGQLLLLELDNGVTEKDDPRNIKSGDEVMIEMHTVDDAIYKFWYTMETGGGAGASNTVAPADPITNIHGGALGYFSAHTVDRKKVIAP